MKRIIYFSVSILIFTNCTQTSNKTIDTDMYKKKGSSIVSEVQGHLLKNLNTAITDSGLVYAINFCNLNAESITNSAVNTNHILSVQRLSNKNRNPKNTLFTNMDKSVFEYFKTTAKDTVVIENDNIIYYKPIKVMMPTCLKCHGDIEKIDSPTIKDILLKYPNDKAVNYKEGDLRGLWKIILK